MSWTRSWGGMPVEDDAMAPIHRLNCHLDEILKERSLDWRSCYTHVASQPPDGRTVMCEASDANVLEALRQRMAPVSGKGEPNIRYEALPRSGDNLPDGFVAVSSAVDVRRTPAHAAELVTQMVYGDAAQPLKCEGEWYLVRLDDGYLGWVRSWHLAPCAPAAQAAFQEAAAYRVASNLAVVLDRPDRDGLPVSDLVVGTHLIVRECARRGWRSVRLSDGKEGFIASRSVEKIPALRRLSRERLCVTGLRFLGIPYLWGGTTPKGFDCSGLIQRIYRLNGAVIPRDADMQSHFGREKPAGTLHGLDAGDLIFFGKPNQRVTHVAMILPEGLFLHAFGQVRVGSLEPHNPLYDAKLIADWCASRDIVSCLNKSR